MRLYHTGARKKGQQKMALDPIGTKYYNLKGEIIVGTHKTRFHQCEVFAEVGDVVRPYDNSYLFSITSKEFVDVWEAFDGYFIKMFLYEGVLVGHEEGCEWE